MQMERQDCGRNKRAIVAHRVPQVGMAGESRAMAWAADCRRLFCSQVSAAALDVMGLAWRSLRGLG